MNKIKLEKIEIYALGYGYAAVYWVIFNNDNVFPYIATFGDFNNHSERWRKKYAREFFEFNFGFDNITIKTKADMFKHYREWRDKARLYDIYDSANKHYRKDLCCLISDINNGYYSSKDIELPCA